MSQSLGSNIYSVSQFNVSSRKTSINFLVCIFLQILPEFNFLLSGLFNKDCYIIISQWKAIQNISTSILENMTATMLITYNKNTLENMLVTCKQFSNVQQAR